jgi:hypothetical protein
MVSIIDRHAGAGLPQLKNFPICQCCHRKIPMKPNPFPEAHQAPDVLHILSVFIRGLRTSFLKGFKVI